MSQRNAAGTGKDALQFSNSRLDQFWLFVAERQAIWYRRSVLERAPPWTQDPVLASNRFTNVYRILDPGTQYVVDEILAKDAPAAEVLFNVIIYRLIGRRETHQELGFQLSSNFRLEDFAAKLHRIRARGEPVFTAAYMVSAYENMGTRDKIENVGRLFAHLRRVVGEIYQQLAVAPSSEAAFGILRKLPGLGDFLAFQILVDLLYHLPHVRRLLPFSNDDWAIAGPGARRGVRILAGEASRAKELQVMRFLRTNQRQELRRLGLTFHAPLGPSGEAIPLSLADVQNCLCEYHKYVKIREGTGRARRRFSPSHPSPARHLTLEVVA